MNKIHFVPLVTPRIGKGVTRSVGFSHLLPSPFALLSTPSPPLRLQYLRARYGIDSQFGRTVDNMVKREMIWSYECRPRRARSEISLDPSSFALSLSVRVHRVSAALLSRRCLNVREPDNKRREMFSINPVLRMTVGCGGATASSRPSLFAREAFRACKRLV